MTDKERVAAPGEWDPANDGVEAAPDSHVVLFENEKIRLLKVTLPPNTTEEFHHHALPSTMTVIRSTFLRYYLQDGSYFDIPKRQASPEAPYVEYLDPEPLHAVENRSPYDTYLAYRVEYKI